MFATLPPGTYAARETARHSQAQQRLMAIFAEEQREERRAMNDTEEEPIHLRTPMDLSPGAKAIMEQHGCLVGIGMVILPIGTRRTPCMQILTITLWYDIVLPDQYQMLEAYDRRRAMSMLYLPPEEGLEQKEERWEKNHEAINIISLIS